MVELISQNSLTGVAWDISELSQSIKWETGLNGTAGKLTWKMLMDKDVKLNEGAPVTFKYNGKNVFYGFIFKRTFDPKNQTMDVTAYDQLRYLKNKDTVVFSDMTANQIFNKVCMTTSLSFQVQDTSWFVVPQKVQDNKSYYEMIEYAIDQTLINTGNWFLVYDDYGKIVFTSFYKRLTNYYLGDDSSITDYKFESSIDTDTFNQVKLVRENKETKKREIFVVKNSQKIKEWGLLQYFETVDEKSTDQQISNRADMLLKVKNRKSLTLKIDSVNGILDIRAGSGIVSSFSDLEAEGLGTPKYFIVSKCTHSFTNDEHTMSLELRMV